MSIAHLEYPCLTEGGLETTLIFDSGFDLPHFAAFTLLESDRGRTALASYYDAYLAVAEAHDLPIVLDTPTWRASLDWGRLLGYSAERLAEVNRSAVDAVRDAIGRRSGRAFVCGAVGPRGDGYVPALLMSAEEAQRFHEPQVRTLAAAGVASIAALTLTYADEAIGIARAGAETGVPTVISFTVETDGVLPSGQSLADAVARVDEATGASPAYYMVNCAHPSHILGALQSPVLRERVRGVRPNASRKSHAELDEAAELDRGDPGELAEDVLSLRSALPNLAVFGGCCGTGERHIAALAEALTPAGTPPACSRPDP